jgi:hypothetical protein
MAATTNRPITLAIARKLAEGHANAGLHHFNELHRLVEESKRADRSLDFNEVIVLACPAATSLSFALELGLKVLHFQHSGTYPCTHDLVAICGKLPTDSRSILESTYDQMFGREEPSECNYFTVVTATATDAQPALPQAVPDVSTFGAALSHASDVFVTWRYLHEHLELRKSMGLHFKAILCLIEAVHAAIQNYKGNARVVIG